MSREEYELAYLSFAADYEDRIVGDIVRIFGVYDGSVPPPPMVVDAMKAWLWMSDKEGLLSELDCEDKPELIDFVNNVL